MVIAGHGGDSVLAGVGDHNIIGDNGEIEWSALGVIISMQTTDGSLGGNDVIGVSAGSNRILGGFGDDQITLANGNATGLMRLLSKGARGMISSSLRTAGIGGD